VDGDDDDSDDGFVVAAFFAFFGKISFEPQSHFCSLLAFFAHQHKLVSHHELFFFPDFYEGGAHDVHAPNNESKNSVNNH
jgi:hypothetical protein